MSYIANDLSITNGFNSHDELIEEFEFFIKSLNSNLVLKSQFYITNNFSNINVNEKFTLSQIIFGLKKTNTKMLIISWLDKSRLFWNDYETANEDNYFECNSIDVTDQGLGECSRRKILNIPVSSFSFGNNFRIDTLQVRQGLPEAILANISIDNIWRIDSFKELNKKIRGAPKSWSNVIDFAKEDFPSLSFSENLLEQISIQPFHTGIVERFFELCNALSEIINSRAEDKSFTDLTNELITKYFHGDKAWFSDENEGDKRDFENELKFYSPKLDTKKSYSFHGKIKIEQIRVYIEWPLKPEHTTIDIVYFGPKITKR